MIKSPLNYIGGKYRLLPQLLPLFPSEIGTFIDLFAGGLDVALNVNARHIVCNDINHYVTGLFEYLRGTDIEHIVGEVNRTIARYGLSKENTEGYYALRSDYNRTHSPLLLFLLICFGFNHQVRFNARGEFNNPFGRARSSYNERTEHHLRQTHRRLQQIELRTGNFRDFSTDVLVPGDFVYADPPYLISCGSYNDGKRGFEGWTATDDKHLFGLLDNLDRRGIRFALSNVLHHKGAVNEPLVQWADHYHIHRLRASYANSNYQARASETEEVLITNY